MSHLKKVAHKTHMSTPGEGRHTPLRIRIATIVRIQLHLRVVTIEVQIRHIRPRRVAIDRHTRYAFYHLRHQARTHPSLEYLAGYRNK